VPETIVARHMGIEVLGISFVTNLAAGLGLKPLSQQEVIDTGHHVERQFARLFQRLIPKINALIATSESEVNQT
jgi:purine-nucleoside phosphorylase